MQNINHKKGIVIRSTGSWYQVKDDTAKVYDCRLKGKFRLKGIKTTNPIAVGDIVMFTTPENSDSYAITEICDRRNYIIRKATKLSKQNQIIAANIDLAILVATINSPKVPLGFIDRFLLTSEAYDVKSILVFNKLDLFDQKQWDRYNYINKIYTDIGYQCILLSAKTGENIDQLKDVIKDKTSLFSGHSGVGKSAIINLLQPNLKLKTSDVSQHNEKGKHTTTFAEMFDLDIGGQIIDTPGIKEFGLRDFSNNELGHYFPEINKEMNNCHFNNCTHTHEPKCAVIEAVRNGVISLERYESYINIITDED